MTAEKAIPPKEDLLFAKHLLVTLQRGWAKNEWPKFVSNYDEPADVAVVCEMLDHHMAAMSQLKPRLVLVNGSGIK